VVHGNTALDPSLRVIGSPDKKVLAQDDGKGGSAPAPELNRLVHGNTALDPSLRIIGGPDKKVLAQDEGKGRIALI